MFEDLKSLMNRTEKKEWIEPSPLTSLNLTPPPIPKKASVEPAKVAAPRHCNIINLNPEGQKAFAAEFKRRYEVWLETGIRPLLLFFGVLPQQGQSITGATQDGKFTIVFLFDTPIAAKAFLGEKQPAATIAGLPLRSLIQQAEKWANAGVNAFAVNPCPICGPRNIYPAKHFDSLEGFMKVWGNETVMRQFRSSLLAQQAHGSLGKDNKATRTLLEYLWKHFDASNPYVVWTLAVFAGMDGDMTANASYIKKLEEFGPPFIGKLHGTSFDMSPGSQLATLPEALMGLLLSYGLLKIPNQPPAAT